MAARNSSPQQTTAITAAVAPVAAAAGVDLEDVQVRRAGSRLVVRILIDTDGGVSLDAVTDVSRAMSQALDDGGVLGERSYLLDVGSPGVDRPLSLLRHWRRNIGRLVRITDTDGAAQTGRIVAATGPADDRAPERVEIDRDGTVTALPGERVRRAVVQVEFS
jgi:ribosome maturation factor RimP